MALGPPLEVPELIHHALGHAVDLLHFAAFRASLGDMFGVMLALRSHPSGSSSESTRLSTKKGLNHQGGGGGNWDWGLALPRFCSLPYEGETKGGP